MEKLSSKRPHRTPAQRAQILVDYHRSGLTQKAFATQAGIGCSTLLAWLRKDATGPSVLKPPTFIPMPNLLPAAGPAAPYQIEFRGFVVTVAGGFQGEELGALLRVLQQL